MFWIVIGIALTIYAHTLYKEEMTVGDVAYCVGMGVILGPVAVFCIAIISPLIRNRESFWYRIFNTPIWRAQK